MGAKLFVPACGALHFNFKLRRVKMFLFQLQSQSCFTVGVQERN